MRLIEDCHDKVIEVTCDMQGAGSTVDVACLYIEKAFDKVWQNGLMYKLHEKGINSTLWQIIADSFKNFKLCVSIQRHRSKWFLVGPGVHQGGPL